MFAAIISPTITSKFRFEENTICIHNFRGGSRKAKRLSSRKNSTSQGEEIDTEEIEMKSLTAREPDEPPRSETVEQKVAEKEDAQEEGEVGWAKMIFNFLKILILGFVVFCYDIISKYLNALVVFSTMLEGLYRISFYV